MIGAPRETWAGLEIVRRHQSPDAALLHDELVGLVERSMAIVGIGPAKLSTAAAPRVVLRLAQPIDPWRVDAFLDELATGLYRRNSGLDLSEWLQVVAVVGTAERAASPLAARVLAAARIAALVIEASEAWYAVAARRDPAYQHVRCEGATFWLRLPGRSTVPGLAPVDLVIGRLPGEPEPRSRARRDGQTVITVHEDRSSRLPDAADGARLEARQRQRLREALVEAYPSFDELALLLRDQLGRNLHRLASPHLRLDLVVDQAIQRAETEGWISGLVTAAFLGNLGNPTLRRLIETGFCDETFALLTAIGDPTGPATRIWPQAAMLADIVADDSDGAQLERIFRRTSAFQNVRQFAGRLLAVGGQVCQVRIGPDAVGTGFLIGPDLVLTNHHVVEDVIGGRVPPSAVQCVFDFSVGENGTVSEGVSFDLHDGDDWLVAKSPPSAADEHDDPTWLPSVDELDYALLRLAKPAGLTRSLDGRERGWLRLLVPLPEPTPGLPLLIVQHPLGGPVKLAMSDAGIAAVNGNRTRLTYRVNTEAGSSGSLCLTFDLRPVAVHHSGKAHHNEGIPVSTIVANLDDVVRAALRGT